MSIVFDSASYVIWLRSPSYTSTIISKSVARGGGRTSYRGLIQVNEGAYNAKTTVKCDALLIDDISGQQFQRWLI